MAIRLGLWDLDNTAFPTDAQLDVTYRNLLNITPFPDTIPTLRQIVFPKVLVTVGNRLTQTQKVKVLGLDAKGVVDECVYCERAEDKGHAFARQIRLRKCEPKEVIVIGDRIDREIRFGNALGCVTVLFCYGKYMDLRPETDHDTPQFRIKSMSELLPIISSLNT